MGLFSVDKEKVIYTVIIIIVAIAIITYLKGWIRN
jgi:Flp pilus assembly pilin Flp